VLLLFELQIQSHLFLFPITVYNTETFLFCNMVKTIIALFALVTVLPVHGFTITMSSYLDRIASGQTAGLTSFAPTSNGQSYGSSYSYGSSPAPASYTTPAPSQSSFSYGGSAAASSYSYGGSPPPAPKPAYVNSFSHVQPNNSLNYIATLGGGSAKKWGRDYTGVSSTFRPTYSVGNASYLDNLKGKIFSLSQPQPQSPVSSSSQSAYTYDPAAWMGNSVPSTSSNSYSYGGSAPAPGPSNQSYSYGGSAPAPAPSNQSYSYGGSPATPSYSYGGSPDPAPSNQSYSYGGSPATPSYSYGGSPAPAPSNQNYSYGGSPSNQSSYSYGGSPAPAPSNESYSYGGSASPSYGASAPATNTAPKSTSSYLSSL
jgi:hypothetical protein